MVILKYIFFLFTVLYIITSCSCDHYVTSLRGLRSKKIYKKYLQNKIDPTEVNINTNIVYEIINRKYEEETKKISFLNDFFFFKKTSFLKFFETGTYYEYNIKKSKNLNKNDFNPLKGNFSYVISRNKKKYFLDYSTVNCGGFVKNDFKVKGDTLIILKGSNKGYRTWYYYIKKEVPEKWLDWQSDI